MRLEFVRIDGTCRVGIQVKVPRLGFSVLDFEESHGELFVNSGVEVVQVLALLGPMSHRFTVEGFDSNIGAAGLEPVVSHTSEAFGALAAEIL